MAPKPRFWVVCAGPLALAAGLAVPWPNAQDRLDRVSVGDKTASIAATSDRPASFVPAVGPWIEAFKARLADLPASLGLNAPKPPEEAPPRPLPVAETPPPPDADLNGVKDAIALYRRGDLGGGDHIAQSRTDPLARLTLDWLAVRLNPHDSGFQRIKGFVADHTDWPASTWLRRRAEDALFYDRADAALVKAYFDASRPIGPAGELALARISMRDGATREAARRVAAVWRDNDLSPPMEALVLKEFGTLLTAADDKFRSDRLLYKGAVTAGLRAAARAGTDALLLARARAAVINNAPNALAMLDSVPQPLRSDAGYQFAHIVALRRAGKIPDAAREMLATPHDPGKLVDGDEWWEERRTLARKLIDLGDTATAYRLCAEHNAATRQDRVDAEVHAGWIALRFLDDHALAMQHFALAAAAADTPDLSARAAYWQGRAAEAGGRAEAAPAFYAAAARYPTAYYGQLATGKLGTVESIAPPAIEAATGRQRNPAVQVVEALYALGARDLALSLAVESAQHLRDEAQIEALGAVTTAYQDARATLIVGKLAASRGLRVDHLAFPTFGIPPFEPVANSAGRGVVYAIARQESAFETGVVSSAGARGLMQLLTSTARETAKRAGIDFDVARLTTDGAFNAKIGAAFLGSLLQAERGSYILTFAAYNAGARRAQEWVSAYGDPRDPAVDPVDWIELIPYDETRNYVQQVIANLEVYQMRFGQHSALLIDRDLRRTASDL